MHNPAINFQKTRKGINYCKNSIHEESYSFSDDGDFNIEEIETEKIQPIKFFEIAFNRQSKDQREKKMLIKQEEEKCNLTEMDNNKNIQNKNASELEGKPEFPNSSLVCSLHSADAKPFSIQALSQQKNLLFSLPKKGEKDIKTDRPTKCKKRQSGSIKPKKYNELEKEYINVLFKHRARNSNNYQSHHGREKRAIKLQSITTKNVF